MVDGCAIHAWRIGRHVRRRRGRLDTGHSAGSTVGIRTADLGASAEAFPKMRTFAMFERPGAILMASGATGMQNSNSPTSCDNANKGEPVIDLVPARLPDGRTIFTLARDATGINMSTAAIEIWRRGAPIIILLGFAGLAVWQTSRFRD